jgi:glutamate-1-semialdehyde 2,1-aminomutase
MSHIAPLGPVYQAGTLSGNPVAVAAGIETLRAIAAPNFYDNLAARTRQLTKGLQARARAAGIIFSADAIGGMFGIYFRTKIPTSARDASACNIPAFKQFFHAMLERGIYFAPSAFEAGFVSAAHDDAVINQTLDTAEHVFKAMAS